MWKFEPKEDSSWRVFKAIKWMEAHDINGDGLIDDCELAKLLKYFGVPRVQSHEKAQNKIQTILNPKNTN